MKTFRLAALLLCFLRLASSQTAAYPSAIATDNNLKVVANNVQTTITFPVLSTDTVIKVASTTGITANTVITLDSENIAVCAVGAGQVTVGQSSCPNTDGRGFDSTVAAAHTATGANCTPGTISGCVSLYIDAWHHNAVKEEVKAIETALGANLANVAVYPSSSPLQKLRRKANVSTTQYEFATDPVANVQDYNFPAQTPGGSLGIGNTTITMAPVPLGVNGTDTGHPLYVSGGTGSAEACTVNGGTGTSGAASGTIILNCAGTHTGAWTVQSASAGLMEAYVANPWSTLYMPRANYLMRACLTFPINGTSMFGLNGTGWLDGSTFASPGNSTGTVLNFSSLQCGAGGAINLSLPSIGTGEAKFSNIYVVGGGQNSGNGIVVTNLARFEMEYSQVANFGTNGVLLNTAISASLFGNEISSNGGCGVLAENSSNHLTIEDNDITGNSRNDNAANVCVESTMGNENDVVDIIANNIESAGVNPYGGVVIANTGGIYVNYSRNVSILGNYLEANNNYAVKFDSGSYSSRLEGNWVNQNPVSILVANEFTGVNNTFWGGGADYSLPAADTTNFCLGPDRYENGATNSRGAVLTCAGLTYISSGNPAAVLLSTLNVGGTITLGGTAQTGTLTLGSSSAAETVNIANGAGAATVAIANVSTAGNTVNVGTEATAAGNTDTLNIETGNAAATAVKRVNILTGTPGTSGNNRLMMGGGATSKVTLDATLTSYTDVNYVTDGGVNNAITATLTDAAGGNISLAAGLRVCVQLAHTLQAGANTFALNGTSKNIKSHFNVANNIGTAYAASGAWCGLYDGTEWVDLSE